MRRKSLASVLDNLRKEEPTKLVSQIRSVWPEIRAALDRGHSVKAIHDRCVKSGVDISYRLLALYVGQLRREDASRKELSSPAKSRIEETTGTTNVNGETAVALVRVPKRRLFSAKAAAQYLGVHEQTLRKITEDGSLAARRLGSRRIYKLEDLDAYIESLPACVMRPRS